MNQIINYLKALFYPIIALIIIPMVLSIGNLIGINSISIVILIIMSIIVLISSYKLGISSINKGYVRGLIFGLIIVTLFFILSFLFKNTYSINTLIYYLILIIISTIGSMLGIQKKQK